MVDFAQFIAGGAEEPKTELAAPAPAAAWVPPASSEQDAPEMQPVNWPIAVYQMVDFCIPGEPFVAYPLVPKKGGLIVGVRCHGQTADDARAKAQAWVDAEVAKAIKRR